MSTLRVAECSAARRRSPTLVHTMWRGRWRKAYEAQARVRTLLRRFATFQETSLEPVVQLLVVPVAPLEIL